MAAMSEMSEHERVHKRSGHIAVTYKGHLLVWGGYVEDDINEEGILVYGSTYHPADEVWLFDPLTELWHRVLTKGTIPPRSSGACGVLVEDDLYIFGGYHGTDDERTARGNSNDLYRLNIPSKQWEWLHPSGFLPAKCDKLVGWAYKGKVYFFGGFGPNPRDTRICQVIPYLHYMDETPGYEAGRGWNNQLVCYNPQSNEWQWPKTDHPPSPRAAHAADICDNKVFVFGGRFRNRRLNDLYCLDMDTLKWSENLTIEGSDNPCGRSWHSFTCVSSNHAVLYGGLNQHNRVLSDCWFFSIPDLKWSKAKFKNAEPRLWHVGKVVVPGELTLVGGHKQNVLDMNMRKDHAEHLVTINFSPKSLLRTCVDAVVSLADLLRPFVSSLPDPVNRIVLARMENNKNIPLPQVENKSIE